MAQEFQSTLPARGATRWFGRSPKQNSISIHAPRTGSDVFVLSQLRRLRIFQSTLPARGATKTSAKDERLGNFNPRSPHGERLPARLNGGKQAGISIHAPRTGSDPRKIITSYTQRDFNPRSPHGERLLIASSGWATPHFNPRSPHGERPAHPLRATGWQHFNPRSPHGERPAHPLRATGWQHFNPRSPHGERPRLRRRLAGKQRISIHAPRTGSDKESRLQGGKTSDFNPRSPHGERRQVMGVCRIPKDFNPRSPHGERPASASCPSPALLISIHAPRTGSDRRRRKSQKWTSRFQSTLPARGATAAKCHRKL